MTVSTKLIPKLYRAEKEKLINVLHKALWISLTVGVWTLRQSAAFMCISGHFIAAQKEKLWTKVLSCSYIKERHMAPTSLQCSRTPCLSSRLPRRLSVLPLMAGQML